MFNKLNELFKTNKNFTTLKEFKRPEILFIIYLSSIEKYNTFERWDDLIWTVINNFNDSQFIIFWKIQNVLSIHGFDDNISIFDYRLEKRNYILRTGKFFAESSDKIDKSQQSIISKIKPRLEKMKKEGFVFTEEEWYRKKQKYFLRKHTWFQ